MTEQQGMFTIPTRLYLTPEQRVRLERFVRAHDLDLADMVSQIVAEYLDALPDLPPDDEPTSNQAAEQRRLRVELRRLRARRDAAGADSPAWLDSYIADLEDELRQMES